MDISVRMMYALMSGRVDWRLQQLLQGEENTLSCVKSYEPWERSDSVIGLRFYLRSTRVCLRVNDVYPVHESIHFHNALRSGQRPTYSYKQYEYLYDCWEI